MTKINSHPRNMISDNDLFEIVSLIKERESMQLEYKEYREAMDSLRVKIERLSNPRISRKFGCHKDVIGCISRGEKYRKKLNQIAPGFLDRRYPDYD